MHHQLSKKLGNKHDVQKFEFKVLSYNGREMIETFLNNISTPTLIMRCKRGPQIQTSQEYADMYKI